MVRVISLLILFLLMYIIIYTFAGSNVANEEASTTLSLGFILLSAYLSGKTIRGVNLPMLTGYLLLGILSGPYVMGLISLDSTIKLRLIDDIALSLIALTAGGELRLTELKGIMKTILYMTISIFTVVTFTITGVIGLLSFYIPFLENQTLITVLIVGLLYGVWAVNSSPDVTIAVITEYEAKGKVTEGILGITILKDVMVIITFTVLLFISQHILSSDLAKGASLISSLSLKVLGSFIVGLGFGWLMSRYIRDVKRETTLFLVGSALFITMFSHAYSLEPLLVSVTAGFYIENFSTEGDDFIKAIEKSSLPVYAVFFAIAGASLNLKILAQVWHIALLFVIIRAFATFLGSRLGGIWSKGEVKMINYGWLGLISQAGVTLGLALMVEQRFPAWGSGFKELAMAVIIFNIMLGPLTLKIALQKAGEIGKGK